ncbi:MAG TPA: hypothetical protein VFO48_06585 [Vicinamibacterales bacterium]|nr:hypothetical protein [Vicinamibacterales bacterium]
MWAQCPVTVTYKEFGVRLTFTPQIAGDIIRLRVRPEVSALDFANGITLEGFRVPALSTRRAETQVESRPALASSLRMRGSIRNSVSARSSFATAFPIRSICA